MSTFTPLANWTTAQDRDAANQIVLAYSERRQSIGEYMVALLGSGANAQDTVFWRGMQEWCESNCTEFVDHTQSLAGGSSIPMLTLSSWRTAAGIASGFRRATEWPTDWTNYSDPAYSYGTIQTGDIRGPWIFEDLQKAFDALRWTKMPVSSKPDRQERAAQGSGGTLQEAINAASLNWDSADWVDSALVGLYYAFFSSEETEDSSSPFLVNAERVRTKYAFSDIPIHIDHSAEAYFVTAGILGTEYNDVDGFTENEYAHIKSFTSATTDSRTVGYVDPEVFPQPTVGIAADTMYDAGGFGETLVLKWDYSHTIE